MVGPTPAAKRPEFHRTPPYSPRHLFDNVPTLLLALATVLTLAVLAAVDGGSALLTVDEPIMEWIVENRTDDWTTFFERVSRLGDNLVVFSIGLVLAVLTWQRCRTLAVALVFAAAIRPGLEFIVKDLIGRDRPDIAPLGEFLGPAHPSGHPLAAVSVWGLVPPIVALFGASRRVWWATTGLVSVTVVAVAASRVYKGAHWPTDVFASIVWGALFLLVVELAYDRAHDVRDERKRRRDARFRRERHAARRP